MVEVMKILSLNAWHGKRYQELKDFLSSELETTDIFCFQETNGDNMEQIMAELFDDSRFSFTHTTKTTDTDRYYSLHTFIKKPLQLLHSEPLFDDNDPETGQALAAKIKIDDTTTIAVVNIHGVPFLVDDKLDTEGRLRQTETIIDWLQKSNLPSVICGDFNLLPEAKSVTNFPAANYRNLIADYGIATTRNRLAWERHPDNIQLFADYTFTSFDIQVKEFSVPENEVSDHLPMIADVDL